MPSPRSAGNQITRAPSFNVCLRVNKSGDTYWVQMQNAPTSASGTTVVINETAPTTDRYNLTICEILAAQ